jgi:hypothetical protein
MMQEAFDEARADRRAPIAGFVLAVIAGHERGKRGRSAVTEIAKAPHDAAHKGTPGAPPRAEGLSFGEKP